MKKIIITTTFRDFKGNINDKMQLKFLYSLKNQTYQNYILVVTTFGEKRVESVLHKVMGEKVVIYESGKKADYRYSPVEVILNGIDYGKTNKADILLDCSGDIILQNNFLEVVENHYNSYFSGVCHPNIFYEIDDGFHVVNKFIGSCNKGIDIRFFDYQLMLQCENILKKYRLYDWGGIELLLTGLCRNYAHEKINIFTETKVIKIENDRKAADENNDYIKKSVARNFQTLCRFAERMGISNTDLFDLYFIHNQYKVTKNKFRYALYFRKDYFDWKDRELRNIMREYL
jgi:hypothetical protein